MSVLNVHVLVDLDTISRCWFVQSNLLTEPK